ncbi:MAG: J domain-containing protein [bacterium]
MAHESLYDVLGVSRDASKREIKRAFRAIARESHPDIAGDDLASAERFERARYAYGILTDLVRRRNYDRGTNVETIGDLFKADPAGVRVREIMRDKARLEPAPGTDVMVVAWVGPSEKHATIELNSPLPLPLDRVEIALPNMPGRSLWGKISGVGPEGMNGAESGNLFVFLR